MYIFFSRLVHNTRNALDAKTGAQFQEFYSFARQRSTTDDYLTFHLKQKRKKGGSGLREEWKKRKTIKKTEEKERKKKAKYDANSALYIPRG